MQEVVNQSQDISNQDSDLPPFNPKLGFNMRQYYTLTSDYINLNNGSFGSCPKYVIKAKEKYSDQLESKPDFFINYTHTQLFEESRKIIGKFLDGNPEDIVFVKNATEGVNVILQSIEHQPGDIILLFDITYGAVKSLCNKLADDYGVTLATIKTNQEILNSKEKLIDLIKENIKQYGKKIKIALLDHISSFPCLLIPIEEIIPIFRENGILCMIDGAHAASQTEFSLKKLDPDFYYTNLHKWSPIPQSVAILYVKKELQHMIHPSTLSRAYKKGFTDEFIRLGTRDFSNIYCVKECMEFWERVGIKRVQEYCHNLAISVGKRVSEIWKTEQLVWKEDLIPFMVNVILPYQENDALDKLEWNETFKKTKATLLVAKYHEKVVVRFSCCLYNELSEYEQIAHQVLNILGIKN